MELKHIREECPIQGPNGGAAIFRLAHHLLQGPALQAFDAANIRVPAGNQQMTFQRFDMVLNEMALSHILQKMQPLSNLSAYVMLRSHLASPSSSLPCEY